MIYAESEFKHSIWVCYQCIPYCVKVGGFKLRAASSLECERVVVTLATENDNVVPSLCLLSVWLPSEFLILVICVVTISLILLVYNLKAFSNT